MLPPLKQTAHATTTVILAYLGSVVAACCQHHILFMHPQLHTIVNTTKTGSHLPIISAGWL